MSSMKEAALLKGTSKAVGWAARFGDGEKLQVENKIKAIPLYF